MMENEKEQLEKEQEAVLVVAVETVVKGGGDSGCGVRDETRK